MSLALSTAVCFIACHGGPADHFATFAQHLTDKGCDVQIHATGPALEKLQSRQVKNLSSFVLGDVSEEETAAAVVKKCAKASIVITDVGHIFDVALQQALADYVPDTVRLAYYDNPEDYVPGGYSTVAAKVMLAAQGVLFANGNLAKNPIYQAPSEEVPLPFEKRMGLGFYPLEQAQKIAKRREVEHDQIRKQFFSKNHLADQGQKVLVYAGGNNTDYFEEAFPAFLTFLAALKQPDILIVLQQHPGAKKENIDANLVKAWLSEHAQESEAPTIVISDFSSDDAQVLADGMLYYQTSMGPQFVLAGIPTIQVGHKCYRDILVRNKLCAVANTADALGEAFTNLQGSNTSESDGAIREGLGISPDWGKRLEEVVKDAEKRSFFESFWASLLY